MRMIQHLFLAQAVGVALAVISPMLHEAAFGQQSNADSENKINKNGPTDVEVVSHVYRPFLVPATDERIASSRCLRDSKSRSEPADDWERFGRPVGVAVMTDGSLLVGDDTNGVLHRLSYGGER